MKLDQKGISRLTLIMIVVGVAMVAVVSLALRPTGNGSDTSETSTTNNNLPDGYERYSTETGRFSLGYPAEWFKPDNMDACNGNVLLLATDPDYLGACGTDEQSQVYIASFAGDLRDSYILVEGRGYSSATGVPYKLSGVTGLRQTGVAASQTGTAALDNGSLVIMYTFYTKGRTYVAQYIQQAGASDQSDIFDEAIKTLRFRP